MIAQVPPASPDPAGLRPVAAVVVVGEPPSGLGLLAPGGSVSGRVAGVDASGQIRIDTLFGTLIARSSQPLPEGAVVRLVVQTLSPQLRLRIAAIDRTSPESAGTRSAAATTAGSLSHGEPAAAAPTSAAGSRSLPGHALPPLGETGPAAARLADAFGDDGWRVVAVPWLAGDAVVPVCLSLRRHRRRPGAERDRADGGRFVVEVRLQRLGRVQLDGLVRAGGRDVDLIVRTEAPLGEAVRRDIRRIFLAAGETAGLAGEVGFRAGPPAFVEPASPPPRGRTAEIVA
jgi:hypothetical protein